MKNAYESRKLLKIYEDILKIVNKIQLECFKCFSIMSKVKPKQ